MDLVLTIGFIIASYLFAHYTLKIAARLSALKYSVTDIVREDNYHKISLYNIYASLSFAYILFYLFVW